MSNEEFLDAVFVGVIAAALCFAASCAIRLTGCRSDFERQAIEQGAAVYQLDSNYTRVFVWKTNSTQKP